MYVLSKEKSMFFFMQLLEKNTLENHELISAQSDRCLPSSIEGLRIFKLTLLIFKQILFIEDICEEKVLQ